MSSTMTVCAPHLCATLTAICAPHRLSVRHTRRLCVASSSVCYAIATSHWPSLWPSHWPSHRPSPSRHRNTPSIPSSRLQLDDVGRSPSSWTSRSPCVVRCRVSDPISSRSRSRWSPGGHCSRPRPCTGHCPPSCRCDLWCRLATRSPQGLIGDGRPTLLMTAANLILLLL